VEPVVVGVDSSTQSCKVVVRSLADGAVVRRGSAPHPPGTEVAPQAWLDALQVALGAAGGFAEDVVGIAVGAQQHGMVVLDDGGEVLRPALLWHDTRSAPAAADLVAELGAAAWAAATGSVPVASFTVTKLRWFAEHEPALADRAAAVCLPHDWLTAQLTGTGDVGSLTTDRGDASGTGYWSPADGTYRGDLLERAFGRALALPRVLEPWAVAGEHRPGSVVSAGTGDNMGAALGLAVGLGDVMVSIGTSGVVAAVTDAATSDASGTVAGFADATGRFLPLACTLNGAPVFDAVAALLGCDLDGLAELACSAEPGAGGLVLVPYFAGERTPNLPDARAELVGMTLANTTPANLARAAIEGVLCGLADGLDALVASGVAAGRVLLLGGAARSPAVQQVAATVFAADVVVPEPDEHVALGAAAQAARAVGDGADPGWAPPPATACPGAPVPHVRDRYREAAERIAGEHATGGGR
jgi:xylulokinase